MLQGEICTAQSRILVPRARYDEIVDAFAEQIAALPVGDPADRDMVDRADDHPRAPRARRGLHPDRPEEGATVKVGGGRPSHLDRGWYLEPTLLADARTTCASSREEIFGPVAVVIPHDGDRRRDRDRQRLAVRSVGHRVDRGRGRRAGVARRVRTGTFALNTYTVDPTRRSAATRSRASGARWVVEGLDGYVEYKSVAVSGPSLG